MFYLCRKKLFAGIIISSVIFLMVLLSVIAQPTGRAVIEITEQKDINETHTLKNINTAPDILSERKSLDENRFRNNTCFTCGVFPDVEKEKISQNNQASTLYL